MPNIQKTQTTKKRFKTIPIAWILLSPAAANSPTNMV